jgi:hypothetical protein
MSYDQMYEVIGQLKTIIAQNREQGKELLLQFPQLSYAFLAMQDRIKNERNMPPGGGGHRPPMQPDPRMEPPRDMRMDTRSDPRGGIDPRMDLRGEPRDDMRDGMDPRMAPLRMDPRDRPPYSQGPPRGDMRSYPAGGSGMPIDPRAGPPPGMSMQGPPPSMHERPPAHMPPMARDDMMMRKDPGAPPGISMVAPGGLMDRQPPGNLMAQRPPQTTQPPPVSTHTPSGMQGLMNLTSMPQVRTLDTCTFFPRVSFSFGV